jgi:hypothetical protein
MALTIPFALEQLAMGYVLRAQGHVHLAAQSIKYRLTMIFHRLSTDTSIDLRKTITADPRLEG